MPKIQILEKNIAELIAAGEVIERPASVVKELLENAIDSGATSITLEIRHGGKTLIRITDNGCGIASEDVSNAFLRHATSKIRQADDLDSIGTLGFRGEALASICAVSKVEMLTKTKTDERGTRYCISGGEEIVCEPAGCSEGTTIVVKELFYNVPARLKFLKKDVTEGNAIQSVLDKIAISHPDISFKFIRDGKRVISTPGNGVLYDTIFSIYGKDFAQSLLEVDSKSKISVSGYASIPMQARSNRSMQHFFINGRYVRSKTCITALEEAYKGSIMVGRFPACVLNIELSYEQVDVNVHPAKIEVRFSDEQAVFEAIYFAVKRGISLDSKVDSEKVEPIVKMKHVERVTFKQPEHEQTVVRQSPSSLHLKDSSFEYSSRPSKFESNQYSFISEKSFGNKPKSEPKEDFEARIIPEEAPESSKPAEEPVKETNLPEQVVSESQLNPPIRMIGELFKTYILAEVNDKLIIIDKHAAHERIIYEQLKKQMDQPMERQLLLTPIQLSVSREEHAAAVEHIEDLEHFGFSVQDFGGNSVLIREIPVVLDQHSCKQVFEDIINNLMKNKSNIAPKELDELYHSMSCKAAIKANDDNNEQELQELLEQVYHDDAVRYCPHGRPVIMTFTRERFERQFGR